MHPNPETIDVGPRYRAISPLGSGGMGAVYLGEAPADDGSFLPVAIKVLHEHAMASAAAAAAFLDEARVGGRIAHPNVVRVLDAGIADTTLFLVMEYVEGVSLSRLLRLARGRRPSPLPIEIATRIVHDLLCGLEAVHGNDESDRVIHRDVSPENVIVGANGRARLTDFGVARFAGRLAPPTGPTKLRGKPAYVAPELLAGAEIDVRADIFSAGIVLWEALTGRTLFVSEDLLRTITSVLSDPIDPPSAHRPEIARALDDVCMRALARDPDHRFETARAFADALANAVSLASQDEVGALVSTIAKSELDRQKKARAPMEKRARPMAPRRRKPTDRATKKSRAVRLAMAFVCGAALALAWTGALVGERSNEAIAAVPSPRPMPRLRAVSDIAFCSHGMRAVPNVRAIPAPRPRKR
jgi:serine/threonine protein kinase